MFKYFSDTFNFIQNLGTGEKNLKHTIFSFVLLLLCVKIHVSVSVVECCASITLSVLSNLRIKTKKNIICVVRGTLYMHIDNFGTK